MQREVRVVINGEERDLHDGITLAELVEEMKLTPQRIAIELNREVVRRSEWSSSKLSTGDRVEVVQFVGGGAADHTDQRR